MAIQSKKPHSKTSALTIFFWIAAVICCFAAAYGAAIRPEETLFWSSIAVIAFILVRYERLAVYVFIFLPLIGELVRLPWGPENGLLLSDLFIPLFAGIWIIGRLLQKKPFPGSSLMSPLMIFCCIAAISLLQAFLFLKPAEILTSSFYLVRFASYMLLFLVVADTTKDENKAGMLLAATAVSAIALAVAGFIQLAVYPDLGKLEQYGWDPHQNRLVSTWLDPNFVGGLLAFVTCILLGMIFYVKKSGKKAMIAAAVAILVTAVFLTYSRSAYLALGAGVIVIGLLKSRKLLIASLVIFVIGVAVLPRAEQRLTDLTHSISSFIFNTSENPDATARLRIKSWEQTWELIGKRPFLGSGYNTLRYVKYNEGFVEDPAVHSASGSDSSLLTILATTGIAGLIPFLWFYFTLLKASLKNFIKEKQPLFARGFSLGLFAAVISLLVHSLFINSLLFPQIMIFLAVQIGILEWIRNGPVRD